MEELSLATFPLQSYDKIRYADTDRQGHVNNAVFATFFETGRVAVLYNPERPILLPEASFVIARLELDFVAELNWPGLVQIGTVVTRIGTSSLTLEQALFQDERCAARARSVIVQVSNDTGKSLPLSPRAREELGRYVRA